MQTLTKTNIVVVRDYDCTTTMNENMKWMKLTHPLSNFSLNLRAPPFVHLLLLLKRLIVFSDVHTGDKSYLYLMYPMYTNA
jgi:hypothetical protein